MFGYIDSISIETQACLSCHRIVTPGIVKTWGKSVADPSNPFDEAIEKM